MARKSAGTKKKFEFVNVDFSESQRSHYEMWTLSETQEIADLLLGIVDNGFKISLSYDERNEAYVGSLTCKTDSTDHAGRIYMIRHTDIDKLIRLCGYYFTEHLMNGGGELFEQDTYSW